MLTLVRQWRTMSNMNHEKRCMNDEMFDELVESMKEALSISKGEAEPSRVFSYSPMNIKEIRERTGKSQKDFADMIGVSLGTLRNWEQGRRYPEGAALTLLKVVSPSLHQSYLQNPSVTFQIGRAHV